MPRHVETTLEGTKSVSVDVEGSAADVDDVEPGTRGEVETYLEWCHGNRENGLEKGSRSVPEGQTPPPAGDGPRGID